MLISEWHRHAQRKNSEYCKLGVKPTPSDYHFGRSIIGPWEIRGRLRPLTRSMVTNFLHAARIGILICDAYAQS